MDFNEYIGALKADEFEEVPVDLNTFLYSDAYMALPPLSNDQYKIIEIGSEIYYEHTLVKLHGEEEGKRRARERKKELALVLGKGSGKDLLSTIICARVAYQLLCLRDPAGYYGKPKDDNIDIVNVAINAQQANKVFFSGLKKRVKNCAWFRGRYKERGNDIAFDKGVSVHSLNSENEATEGLNIMVAVLDEIDGFDEHEETVNADKMYKTLRATVASRFADTGKILLLSFPRTTKGFIMRKYNEFVAEKVVSEHSHTFKLNPELPDDVATNEFRIDWTEDDIVSYRYGNVWALRRPTWRVNPTKSIDDFTMDFYADPADSLGRFAAQPSDYEEGGFFRDKAKIDATFTAQNGIDEEGSIVLKPGADTQYYIHVDLAKKHDNCALAVAHVDSMKQIQIGNRLTDPAPHVVVDILKVWKPTRETEIDFADVREFIINVRRAGFNIKLITFDRWAGSFDLIPQLQAVGFYTDTLSVGREQYNELQLIMGENRLVGPDVELIKEELKRLQVLPNGNVDHPSKMTKDASDAVAGAVANAVRLTPKQLDNYEVVDYGTIRRIEREAQAQVQPDNIVRAPTRMPDNIRNFLDDMRIL